MPARPDDRAETGPAPARPGTPAQPADPDGATAPAADLPEAPELDEAAEDLDRRRAEAEADRRAIFAALLAEDPFIDEDPDPQDGPPAHVTAVLVAHDGAAWLPDTLRGLLSQTRPPDLIVAVDTGSRDGSAALLTEALGADRVISAPRDSGYGAALATGLAAVQVPDDAQRDRREWVWLLHDDGEPDPQALQILLRHARRNPSAAILGAKAVDWRRPERLVEIGLTTDSAGRRVTDLDRHELDQGQHDQPRDVLAVGTAGALVRRDAWDALGGLDPALPLLRDDIDLGWRATLAGHRVVVVPTARIRHARATQTGQRRRDAMAGRRRDMLPGRLRRQDRAHGLYVHLVNRGGLLGGLPGLPLMLLSALVRATVLLLTRRPRPALDELAAAWTVLSHPRRLAAGRRLRRDQRRLPPRAARPLLSRTGARLRATLLAGTDLFAGVGEAPHASSESGEDELPAEDGFFLRRLLWRPSLGLVAGLGLLGLLADRRVLHTGALQGGRLLPVPAGAADLMRSYAAAWHPGALGSTTPAAPWQPVLAALAVPFGGSPAVVLNLLFLGALPLAGLAAWWATRRTTLPTPIRLWGAVGYALLPPVTGALAGGRFDALVAVLAAPLLLSGAHRLLTRDPSPGGWNHAFALGLSLALVAAFSPPAWLLLACLLGGGALALLATAGPGQRASAVRRALAALIAAVVAPLLLWPFTVLAARHPRELLVGLGGPGQLAGQAGPPLRAADLLLLHPGGPGLPPVWLAAPLLAAAGAGLLRREHRRLAGAGAAVALLALTLALVVARTGAVRGGHPPYGWPGPELAFAGAGLLAAGLVGANGAREALAGRSFGITQPAGVLTALLALAVPLAAAAVAVQSGTTGELTRRKADPLPPFVLDDAQRDPGQRILHLTSTGPAGVVGYRIEPVTGSVLGDEELRPGGAADRLLSATVADLASNRGTDAAELLSTFHVRYVALPAGEGGGPGGLDGVLDNQPALSRVAVPGRTLLWQLLVPSSRAELIGGDLAGAALDPAPVSTALGRGPLLSVAAKNPPQRLPAAGEGVRADLPEPDPAAGQRLVVVAESRDPGWQASLDGHPLGPVTAWGWAQGFTLPGAGGHLVIRHAAGSRRAELIVQAIALVVVLVLAAPGVRRREEELDPDLPDEAATPAEPAAEAVRA